ncbi:divergent protein kinase domain 1C isoform X2 [Linepithema humile]|uniref:divergent protein kinase domain 1C isoform X2 n=1 Tax=Linepithema humile TaxID=83485 RepID=UPI000623B3DA|nr:PREDICTED: protein FAM69C isoform X2 [Linepithema humile]
MNVRRLPGFLYNYKLATIILTVGPCLVVYLLLHWGVMCTNLEAWRHVSTVCSQHRDGAAIGILCEPLCAEKGIHSLVCEARHAGKEAVFSAHWEATRLVFKASRTKATADQFESFYLMDATGSRRFPSEEDFMTMIRDVVVFKLNTTVTRYQVERLARLRTHRMETDPERRQLEMENLWPLLQENEYLMAILYEDRDVFPQLIGTCGTFYAVEYVRPIETPTTVLALSDSKPEWAKRLKLAVMILDLLDELETNFHEPLQLCDVKINHFGLPLGGQKLKFLDLDSVFPRTVISRFIADGKSCEQHKDCDYLDCRSMCSKNKRCESPVLNNNLQIICEKIFLGWTLSGTIIIPGLLMSVHTTSTLAVFLRQCANPDGDTTRLPRAAAPESLKKRLYNMLNEMEHEYSAFV